MGSNLASLKGYPFEVRFSDGALARARVSADLTADGYAYLSRLFSDSKPDIALIVADAADWKSRQPYGLPFYNDEEGQIRPGIVVMPAGKGDFWIAIGESFRETSPLDFEKLCETYPDGSGGMDLQPFFDLITIHELGHAFEVLGGLNLPTFWLGEIFANLCLHAFVATQHPQLMKTLATLSIVGTQSARWGEVVRADGFSTLDELEAHYTGGDNPMRPLNYVWYQCRWQRLAATMFDVDGETGLVRFWEYFRSADRIIPSTVTASSLVPLLSADVSATLGRAVLKWR